MKWLFFCEPETIRSYGCNMITLWSNAWFRFVRKNDIVTYEAKMCAGIDKLYRCFFKDGKQGILTHKLYDVSRVKPGFNFLLP
jgi:hypothetical protein